MKQLIKNFLKKNRRNLYIFLKKYFFLILQKLDTSFSENISSSIKLSNLSRNNSDDQIQKKLSSFTTNARAQHVAVSQPTVINSDDALANAETIGFLLETIFSDASLRSFVLEKLGPHLTGGESLFEIEKLIHTILDKEKSEKNSPVLENFTKQLNFHEAEVQKNKNAYSTKNKICPNAVFWPDPTNEKNNRSIFNELPFVKREPILYRNTPVGSAGSCFASEIAMALQREKFNYVITEQNIGKEGHYRFMSPAELPVSCAAWGTIFNTPSFLQLAEKAFDERALPKILWTEKIQGQNRFYDPFRENIEFESIEAFEANYVTHKTACREAFLKCKVFVITLGLNEIWYFKADGSVFSRSPWKMASSLIGHRIMTVEENVAGLQRMLDILRAHNPDIKLIVTLSPIGLHATFRGDTDHVISANSHSKAVLRVAAEEFVSRNKDVFYFPSYEMVNFCTQNPYNPDQRNVRRETVQGVMRLFSSMFKAED